ncbi:unnamed protein product [Polarella glacialis]|uniref:Uncharacterized protein n=1 Tax=Polarella glacialis TaxID=89957 RepID=A0A813H948_POLGL|nr:unnamed protein product [Polarella glacialis]
MYLCGLEIDFFMMDSRGNGNGASGGSSCSTRGHQRPSNRLQPLGSQTLGGSPGFCRRASWASPALRGVPSLGVDRRAWGGSWGDSSLLLKDSHASSWGDSSLLCKDTHSGCRAPLVAAGKRKPEMEDGASLAACKKALAWPSSPQPDEEPFGNFLVFVFHASLFCPCLRRAFSRGVFGFSGLSGNVANLTELVGLISILRVAFTSARLQKGISVLQLAYRPPGDDEEEAAEDVMTCVDWLLARNNCGPLLLIGWSMGSAAVVEAAYLRRNVPIKALITLAAQTAGTRRVKDLEIPLLALHGLDAGISVLCCCCCCSFCRCCCCCCSKARVFLAAVTPSLLSVSFVCLCCVRNSFFQRQRTPFYAPTAPKRWSNGHRTEAKQQAGVDMFLTFKSVVVRCLPWVGCCCGVHVP